LADFISKNGLNCLKNALSNAKNPVVQTENGVGRLFLQDFGLFLSIKMAATSVLLA
jgi:hypothetical protein